MINSGERGFGLGQFSARRAATPVGPGAGVDAPGKT